MLCANIASNAISEAVEGLEIQNLLPALPTSRYEQTYRMIDRDVSIELKLDETSAVILTYGSSATNELIINTMKHLRPHPLITEQT
jgi:hypothetical protein